MSQKKKVLQQVLCGTADGDIRFRQFRSLLKALGFNERIRGDYYIFTREDVE